MKTLIFRGARFLAGPYVEIWKELSAGGKCLPIPARVAITFLAGTLSYILLFAMINGVFSFLI